MACEMLKHGIITNRMTWALGTLSEDQLLQVTDACAATENVEVVLKLWAEFIPSTAMLGSSPRLCEIYYLYCIIFG